MKQLRVHSAALLGLALVLSTGMLTQARAPTLDDRAALAGTFDLANREIPLPAGADWSGRALRDVNPAVHHIRAWISSVGASAALGDVSGNGLPDDLCLVDPRVDEAVLHSVAEPAGYEPILLQSDRRNLLAPSSPMGCVLGDFNESGRTDVLVYYWGRSPLLFLQTTAPLSFVEQEVLDPPELVNTNAVTVADVDGDGHLDIVIGNYFPDGARVLDPEAHDDEFMEMQDSMSRAYNGGTNRLLRWSGLRPDPDGTPRVRFEQVPDAFPGRTGRGWTLALGAADLDGDLLPELYVANDFGPDRMLHNTSAPGEVNLEPVTGRRGLLTPASKIVGRGSFKGMGVDFGDLEGRGLLDITTSNIATDWALHESHYTFVHTGEEDAFARGHAPYVDRSDELGTARGGWGWDVKAADLNNSGQLEIVQATGFVRGRSDRWPELHELAMSNDSLLRHPRSWPRFAEGDDLSGRQPNPLFVRGPDGRFHDLSGDVGLGAPYVTRGIALADVDASGGLDAVFANQWEPSVLVRNGCSECGNFVGLDLRLPLDGEEATAVLEGRRAHELHSRPAVGAQVLVTAGERTHRAVVDGGNGHSGQREPGVHVGLGPHVADSIEISYRDADGVARRQVLDLDQGWHTVLLGNDGEELP